MYFEKDERSTNIDHLKAKRKFYLQICNYLSTFLDIAILVCSIYHLFLSRVTGHLYGIPTCIFKGSNFMECSPV